MSTNAVVVEDVRKVYRSGVGSARIREMIPSPFDRGVARVFPKWWHKNTFEALSDVSVAIEKYGSLGIIGYNGAGKTTLLKVIAGITAPTTGRVALHGRCAALIDALVGFHPDLTGRENVYLLGSMHGFGRKTMKQRLEQVFDFAGIHELVDTPLKRFSAGMSARLGFATITALEADVLLVDEILAVGDGNFQRKCNEWLADYRSKGGTLLFVSHNMKMIRSMTEKVLWLNQGRVAGFGRTTEVLADYARALETRDVNTMQVHSKRQRFSAMHAQGMHRWGAGGARVEKVQVRERSGHGDDLEIAIDFEAPDVDHALVCVGFVDEGGKEIGAAASPMMAINGGRHSMQCAIDSLPLRSGVYFPVVAILSPDGVVRDHWRLDRAIVIEGDGEAITDAFGPVDIAAAWSGS